MYVCIYEFLLQNGLFCVLFALSLLAGGIAEIIFASQNNGRHDELCISNFDSNNLDVCDDILRAVIAQATAAVSTK